MCKFSKRAYGFVVIKAINSNFNADFSGQPRTLPSGQVYATDKALKYAIRNYLKDKGQTVFYFKSLKEDLNPRSITEAYQNIFKQEVRNQSRCDILKNLKSAIDVRLFGATFAPKGEGADDKNISIHGSVQFTHGINIWHEGNIYSEQIMSPFRNPNQRSADASATTLGRQSRLEEGHYIFHFSINPKNLDDSLEIPTLTNNDIELLKEAMRRAVTYYDSTTKAGCENEIFFYIELNENSSLVLPSFINLVKMKNSLEDNKRVFNLEKVASILEKYQKDISLTEIYYNEETTIVNNLPKNCQKNEL